MNDQEQRLTGLEDHADRTERRLEAVEVRQVQHGNVLEQHTEKLDRIFQAVTKQEARPNFDMVKTLSVVALIMAILTPLAGLSIWTISIVTAATDEEFRVKFHYIERDIDRMASKQWRPGSGPPG